MTSKLRFRRNTQRQEFPSHDAAFLTWAFVLLMGRLWVGKFLNVEAVLPLGRPTCLCLQGLSREDLSSGPENEWYSRAVFLKPKASHADNKRDVSHCGFQQHCFLSFAISGSVGLDRSMRCAGLELICASTSTSWCSLSHPAIGEAWLSAAGCQAPAPRPGWSPMLPACRDEARRGCRLSKHWELRGGHLQTQELERPGIHLGGGT